MSPRGLALSYGENPNNPWLSPASFSDTERAGSFYAIENSVLPGWRNSLALRSFTSAETQVQFLVPT